MASQKPTFKAYKHDQILMLAPSLDELVAKSYPLRVVNDVINKINIYPLTDAYESNGC